MSRMPRARLARPPRLGGARAATSLAAGVLAASALAGCSSGSGESEAGDGATPAGAPRVLTVLAAASLTDAFGTVERIYERDHPGVDVRVSFGSSTTLAQQVAQGAPADLVAFAGTSALAQLPARERALTPSTIARTTLQIATPPGNPARVGGLRDLARDDVDVVLCVATAPCGKAADTVLAKAKVSAHVVSRETDVRTTLAKVRLDEADAALVYRSDVAASRGQVEGVDIPAADNVELAYPMLRLTDTADARGFADFVTGSQGLAALTAAGFSAP